MPTIRMLGGLGLAYGLGAVPTGYWLAQARKGIDIRRHGSGNIGASNVGRVLGKPWGILVLILDILKGTLAVLSGATLFYFAEGPLSLDAYKILCAVAAVCGHNWTVFLKFRGGKGVATSAGALLGLAPMMFLSSAILWGIAAKLSGYISVASMTAAVGFCAMTFAFKTSAEMKIFGVVMAAILILKHRENILSLLQGKEPKIGNRKTDKVRDAV